MWLCGYVAMWICMWLLVHTTRTPKDTKRTLKDNRTYYFDTKGRDFDTDTTRHYFDPKKDTNKSLFGEPFGLPLATVVAVFGHFVAA